MGKEVTTRIVLGDLITKRIISVKSGKYKPELCVADWIELEFEGGITVTVSGYCDPLTVEISRLKPCKELK